jgi:tRNA threonylcarbamoyladenosine biosynthesis protein TsaE
MEKIIVSSKKEMAALAKETATKAQVGDIIALKGTLGAGKTYFAANFINFLSDEPHQVLSPTFNLVNSYPGKKGMIFHFDLYRLKSPLELENIGFFDALKSGISLIEWPEIAASYLQEQNSVLEIEIKIIAADSEERREVFLKRSK